MSVHGREYKSRASQSAAGLLLNKSRAITEHGTDTVVATYDAALTVSVSPAVPPHFYYFYIFFGVVFKLVQAAPRHARLRPENLICICQKGTLMRVLRR